MAVDQEVLGILIRLEGKTAFIAAAKEEQAAIKGYAKSVGEAASSQDAMAASGTRMASTGALVKKVMGGIVLATAGVVVESIKAAIKYNDMGKEISQQTGLTGHALDSLMETIKHTASHAPYAITEIADAAVLLRTRFHQTDSQIEHTAGLLTAFAKRAGGDSKTVGTAVLSILQDFREPLTNLLPFMDKLTAVAQATQKPLGDVLGVVEKYGPKLQAMGYNLQETITLLGVFQQSGITTAMMGRGLSSALTLAQKEHEKTGESIPDVIKRHMQEIKNAQDQQEAFNLAMQYFGKQVGPSFGRALYNNAEAFNAVNRAQEKTGGTMHLFQAEQKEIGGKWQELKNQMFEFGVGMGEQLLPAMQTAFRDLMKVTEATMSVTDNGKILLPIIFALAGAWGVYKGAVVAANIAQGIWDTLVGVGVFVSLIPEITSLADAWYVLDAAMDANPVGVIALAIVGLGFLIYHFRHQIGEVINWIKSHWASIGPALLGPLAIVIPWVVTHWKKLGDDLAHPFDFLWSKAKWVFDHIKKEAKSLLDHPLSHLPLIGGIGADLGLPGFASGGTMAYSGFARINENGPGETVWLPSGASVQPSPASSLLAPRAHTPNPTTSDRAGGTQAPVLEAVLVMPNGDVLAELVTKSLTIKRGRL